MDSLERILALRAQGVPFATATVVSRKAPVSSQLGDKAVILKDGTVEGFIGGACSRDIVRRQALLALKQEQPRLVRISPDPVTAEQARSDEICVPMTCASEGALDVYIEPHVEKKHLLIAGGSPVAVALALHGALQGYEVSVVCEPDEEESVRYGLGSSRAELIPLSGLGAYLSDLPEPRRRASEVIVASMGHYDEAALLALAELEPRYLGLVSSRKRGETAKALLSDQGLNEAQLARIRNPVGLDIGAKTPNEVAVSILAEMIQLRRQAVQVESLEDTSAEAVDPVCGMSVTIATAKHSAEHLGETYYFCCPNCRHHFTKHPAKYLTVA